MKLTSNNNLKFVFQYIDNEKNIITLIANETYK